MKLELRKMMHNLSALTEIGSEISSSNDFDEVVRASLHTLLGTLAIPRGAIARFSSSPRQLKVIAAKGLRDAVGQKIALGRDEAEKLAARKRPLELAAERNGLSHFVRRNGEAFEQMRVQSLVSMVVRGELVGVIFLSEKFTGDRFSEEDRQMLTAMARHIGLAFHNNRLMVSLKRKAEENRRLYRQARQMYQDTVRAFGAAIDLKDAYTKGHSDRVARYSEAIAKEMGISGIELEHIGVAGYLHDVGKITVDRTIINNPRPLTEREFSELNKHVTTGYEILANINRPWKEIAYMTKCHHEKVDGTGYPSGLRGPEIPLGSKIVTVADSFDAMMTDRPYRSRLPLGLALEDFRRNAGKQFDEDVIVAFCRLLQKEITGTAGQRIFLPVIGIKFDRPAILRLLDAIIEEFDGRVLQG